MQRQGGVSVPVEANEAAVLVAEVRDFIASRRMLCIASLTRDGRPHASTAPFLASDGCFYLLLSDLSEHAINLRAYSQASVLLQADEVDTRQPFARLRLSFEVEVVLIERDQPLWRSRIERMRERFGAIVDQLVQLQDFNLFELRPSRGRYVKGFGRAYELDGLEQQLVLHVQSGAEGDSGGT
ncbi:MAG: pyridoxamine 5'-phosphate oxidase family protein [Oceanospirillaceae bacterium]|nr:pyridoxamine 5'-phosphate oxidase family protein [Oceanospirillaceae bacterium]